MRHMRFAPEPDSLTRTSGSVRGDWGNPVPYRDETEDSAFFCADFGINRD